MAEIRSMRENEVESVVQLWNANWLDEGGYGLSEADARRIRGALQSYLSHPDVCCLVSEDQGRLVGFVTTSVSSHPVMEGCLGEIEELYVEPPTRHTGVRLVEGAVDFCRARGATVFRTHMCADSHGVKAFWRQTGWKQDMAVFSLYEEDETVGETPRTVAI